MIPVLTNDFGSKNWKTSLSQKAALLLSKAVLKSESFWLWMFRNLFYKTEYKCITWNINNVGVSKLFFLSQQRFFKPSKKEGWEIDFMISIWHLSTAERHHMIWQLLILCLGLKRYKKGGICRSEISSLATVSREAGKAYDPTEMPALCLEATDKFTSKETLFQFNLVSALVPGFCSAVIGPE